MEKLKLRSGPFHRIGDQYKRMMGSNHFMGRDAFADSWIAPPKAKLTNGDNCDKIEIALPGFTIEEIDVFVEGDRLSIEAKKKAPPVNYVRYEFNVSPVSTSYQLPKVIKKEEISTSYDNGVLKIKLPHDEEAYIKRKVIEVT